jgi:hypothetical protein
MSVPVSPVPSAFDIKNVFSLLLPAKNYAYFRHADQYPFEPTAQAHSVVNAWWLAEHSLLVYEDESNVKKIIGERGKVTWIEADKKGRRTGVDGYGFEADDVAIICFRGTEFYSPQDMLKKPSRLIQMAEAVYLDILVSSMPKIKQDPYFDEAVHAGFYRGLCSVWEQVNDFINSVGDKPIWLTGHSLGAAMSTLLAYQKDERIQGLYTYGSPCVGSAEFTKKFSQLSIAKNNFRYKHGNDLVTEALDNRLKYQHVGDAKHLSTADNNSHNSWLGKMSDKLTPTRLVNHAPMYYVLHTLNEMMAK